MAYQVRTSAIAIDQMVPLHISFHLESASSSDGWKRDCSLARNSNTSQISFRVSWVLFLVLFVVAASATAQSGSAVPTVQVIVERMGQARVENRARFRPYVVT